MAVSSFASSRSPTFHNSQQLLQGVWEKDEIRKDDSFTTFREIFELALAQKVDLVLLGGDLFHDNKPTRTTLVRAVNILTEFCMNDSPIAFDILSNQKENFASG